MLSQFRTSEPLIGSDNGICRKHPRCVVLWQGTGVPTNRCRSSSADEAPAYGSRLDPQSGLTDCREVKGLGWQTHPKNKTERQGFFRHWQTPPAAHDGAPTGREGRGFRDRGVRGAADIDRVGRDLADLVGAADPTGRRPVASHCRAPRALRCYRETIPEDNFQRAVDGHKNKPRGVHAPGVSAGCCLNLWALVIRAASGCRGMGMPPGLGLWLCLSHAPATIM